MSKRIYTPKLKAKTFRHRSDRKNNRQQQKQKLKEKNHE
jgi:hypothetical protein